MAFLDASLILERFSHMTEAFICFLSVELGVAGCRESCKLKKKKKKRLATEELFTMWLTGTLCAWIMKVNSLLALSCPSCISY